MNILILTGKFGMGHYSAAEAIKQEIEENYKDINVNIKIIDIIDKDNILEMKNKKSIFDTSKVESHSAITPTTKVPKDLTGKELDVYNIIKNRFISNFLKEDTILEETTIIFSLGEYDFKLKGSVVKSLGYLNFENDLKEKHYLDLQLESRYNVIFQYQKRLHKHLNILH